MYRYAQYTLFILLIPALSHGAASLPIALLSISSLTTSVHRDELNTTITALTPLVKVKHLHDIDLIQALPSAKKAYVAAQGAYHFLNHLAAHPFLMKSDFLLGVAATELPPFRHEFSDLLMYTLSLALPSEEVTYQTVGACMKKLASDEYTRGLRELVRLLFDAMKMLESGNKLLRKAKTCILQSKQQQRHA